MSFVKSNKEIELFLDVFKIVKKDIIEYLEKQEFSRDIIYWVNTNIDVNVIGGKYMRGLSVINTVIYTLKEIKGVKEIDQDTLFLANICGWCIEFLQAFLLVADDIMDNGEMRRGHLCWYKYPNPISNSSPVGNIAVNDAFILESCIYLVLKKYFKKKAYYSDLFDLFQDISRATYIGQLLDTNVAVLERGDFTSFNLITYSQIAKYKSSYFSLYGPIAIGLVLCDLDYSDSKYDSMKELLFSLGEYMNCQDDYLDLYGDPLVTGKVGTDIEENKRSWFICQALLNANPIQTQLLKDHYGRDNKQDVQIVKNVYKEIDLLSIYRKYEEAKYNELLQKIESETSIPKQIYLTLLNGAYKRNK